jgi:large subunit ribosomal protein L32
MRINRSATRKRRSHHALTEPRLSTCKDCGAKYLRHRACNECGKYRGRVVEDIAGKTAKKAAKKIAQLEGAEEAVKEKKVATPEKKDTAKKAPKASTAKKAPTKKVKTKQDK